MNSTIHKILVIRFSSLGDVLLSTPLLHQLREKYPRAQIDFLVRSDYAELLRYNPNISNLIEFNNRTGFNGLRDIRKRIQWAGYDVIIDIHRNLRSRFICLGINRFFRKRTRILKVRKNQIIRFLLVKFKINLYRRLYGRVIPVWEKYLRAAAPLGLLPVNGQPQLFLPENAQSNADSFLRGLPAGDWQVIIAPGARHFTKRWLPEYYAVLIRRLFEENGWHSILVGGEDDVPVIENILTLVPRGSAISVADKLTLPETAALIARAGIMVTNDSGLMHVGSATGIPLVAIFGSTVEELGFFPSSPQATVLENKGLYCRPCTHVGRESCPETHFRCMKEIKPYNVIEIIPTSRAKPGM